MKFFESFLIFLTLYEFSFSASITKSYLESKYPITITSIYIKTSGLDKVEANAFSNFLSLQSISIHSDTISAIESYSFSNLSNLVGFSMSGNLVTTIQPYTYVNLPKLVEISISKSNIESLSDNAFTNASSLQNFYFFENKLTFLNKKAFINTKIKRFIIEGNLIAGIPSDFFSSTMPEVGLIDLRSNKIDSIVSGTFNGLENLTSIILFNNGMLFC